MFAATLFCSKLVAYVFLYWLPYYLNAIPIGGKRLTPAGESMVWALSKFIRALDIDPLPEAVQELGPKTQF